MTLLLLQLMLQLHVTAAVAVAVAATYPYWQLPSFAIRLIDWLPTPGSVWHSVASVTCDSAVVTDYP